jgi:hypothetical protein
MNENENTDNIGNFGEYNAVSAEPVNNHPSLQQLKDKIADLEHLADSWKTDHDIMKERWIQGLAAIEAIKSNVKEAIVSAVEADDLGKTTAMEIFESCEIEHTKSVTISGSIVFSGNVEVSVFEDEELESVIYNTSVNNIEVEFNGESLRHLDYNLDDAEWEDN